MPARSKIEIWNLALSEIRAGRVESENEASPAARECRLHYPQAVGAIMEGPARFPAFIRRAPLVAVTNDRDSEWGYAYAVPTGTPLRVLPNFDGEGLGLPVPLPGDPYAETWSTAISRYETPYIIAGDKLYSHTANATIEYLADGIDGVPLPSLTVDAIAMELAFRLAVPLKGDADLKKSLAPQAELALQRAIAAQRNREPVSYGSDYVSEAERARMGWY